jgi:type VI secretion system protein ImpH
VNFFGLTGPQGVLPYWYTHLVADQLRRRRTALASFLDMFQHRMLSHLYRAWAKPRAPIEHERVTDDVPARDRTTLLLRAFVGLPPRLRAGEHQIHEDTLLFYSGLFGQHHRSAVAFEQMVSDYFEVPVEVLQFVGAWYRVPDQSRCRIGEREDSTTALGIGTVVGDEIWDPQVRVRLRIGPLTKGQFDDFLPSGSAYGELQELSRLFAGDEVDFELQLVLGKEAVPPFVLDSDGSALQLGWNTWIRTAPFVRDTDDTTLTL